MKAINTSISLVFTFFLSLYESNVASHTFIFKHIRSHDDKGYESFFHISIVEGDISLVLDSEALSRYRTVMCSGSFSSV